MKCAIKIQNLTKRFGKKCILENINMSVEEGEFVAIVGASGCGKSTLLNMIGLLETFDKGIIEIKGKGLPKIESSGATKMRRNTINYLFQSCALINDMTVVDNLLLAMKFQKINKKEKLKKIDEILEKVGLLGNKNAMVNTMSGGEQQRVALARTILKEGEIILADEPTGALDPQSAHIVFQLIKDMCKNYGKTVLMVTHNMELARQTDRIIEL